MSLKKVILNIVSFSIAFSCFAQNPINIGFSSIDDNIRSLQLQGKVDGNISLMNRPFYTNSEYDYRTILKTIDPLLQTNNKSFNYGSAHLELLPLSITQQYNSSRPFGWNNQAFGYSKGYQGQLTTGLYAQWGILHIQLQPELVNYANGNFAKKTAILPGQSFIGLQTNKLGLGLSNQNMWWGPGRYASLLMSNNAPGFEHIRLHSIQPINIGLGHIEFTLVLGRLNRDTAQGFENYHLQKRYFDYTQSNTRQFNGFNFVFQPKFLKNVFIGFNRMFQNYEKKQPNASLLTQYLPVLNGLYKSNYADDTLSKDQLLSINTRWIFPQNHAEIYFEYGFNDAKQNVRDLVVDMSHSSAYTFGFRKINTLSNDKLIDWGFEATKMSQTPSYIQRSAGNWYEHGQVLEGYTQNNQIMGVGAGHGNDLQTLSIDLKDGFDKIGLKFQHISHNPYLEVFENSVKLRNTKWDDFVFGTTWGRRFNNLIVNANVEWVNARNYNYINGTHKGNVFIFLNAMYLW